MSISKPQNILSIQNRDEFRQWLMTHHATARECWVKVKRVRIDTIQIKKKQRPLFESRLKKFIDNTRLGVIYGEWNDNGRL